MVLEYTDDEVQELLRRAEQLGLPLNRGSYLEQLTVAQLRALVDDVEEELN